MSTTRNFKIILAGPVKSGKSTFLAKCRLGDSKTEYEPSYGLDVQPLTLIGQTTLDVWDTPGHEDFAGLRNGYYVGTDAAVVFIDFSVPTSLNTALKYIQAITNVAGDIPILIAGNKLDKVNGESYLPKTNYPPIGFYKYQIQPISVKYDSTEKLKSVILDRLAGKLTRSKH